MNDRIPLDIKKFIFASRFSALGSGRAARAGVHVSPSGYRATNGISAIVIPCEATEEWEGTIIAPLLLPGDDALAWYPLTRVAEVQRLIGDGPESSMVQIVCPEPVGSFPSFDKLISGLNAPRASQDSVRIDLNQLHLFGSDVHLELHGQYAPIRVVPLRGEYPWYGMIMPIAP